MSKYEELFYAFKAEQEKLGGHIEMKESETIDRSVFEDMYYAEHEKLRTKTTQLEEYRTEATSLRLELENMHEKVTVISKELERKKLEVEKYRTEKDVWMATTEELEVCMIELNRLKTLRNESKSTTFSDISESNNERYKQENELLQKELTVVKDEEEKWKKLYVKNSKELENCRAELTSFNTSQEELFELRRDREKLAIICHELDTCQKQLQESIKEQQDLSILNESYKNELTRLNTIEEDYKTATIDLFKLQSELSKYPEWKSSREELMLCQAELSRLRIDKEKWLAVRVELVASKAESNALKIQLDSLKSVEQQALSEKTTLVVANNQLEESLQNMKKEIISLQTRVWQLEAGASDETISGHRTTDDLILTKAKALELELSLASMNSDKEALQIELLLLQNKNNQLTNENNQLNSIKNDIENWKRQEDQKRIQAREELAACNWQLEKLKAEQRKWSETAKELEICQTQLTATTNELAACQAELGGVGIGIGFRSSQRTDVLDVPVIHPVVVMEDTNSISTLSTSTISEIIPTVAIEQTTSTPVFVSNPPRKARSWW